MRVIAVSNQKGGSSKSTTAVNLAAALGERKRHVLVVDLDSQAHASLSLGIRDAERSMADVLKGEARLSDVIRETSAPNVVVAPGAPSLVTVEAQLSDTTALRGILDGSAAGPWDYALIDCPPALSMITLTALTVAGEVLIPVEARFLAVEGLTRLQETIDTVRVDLNPDLPEPSIVACRVHPRARHSREIVEELREAYGPKMYRTVIRENIRLSECAAFGEPITIYDSRSAGAEDYRALAGEVLRQEKGRK